MIIYRKAAQLRTRRATTPDPPFWYATAISPYSARRGAPISVDYLDLRASYSDRLEVGVAENVIDDLERSRQRLAGPVLIEAAEFSETVFRRGQDVLRFCRAD